MLTLFLDMATAHLGTIDLPPVVSPCSILRRAYTCPRTYSPRLLRLDSASYFASPLSPLPPPLSPLPPPLSPLPPPLSSLPPPLSHPCPTASLSPLSHLYPRPHSASPFVSSYPRCSIITAATLRILRLATNAFLSSADLVLRTMAEFAPDPDEEEPSAEELEAAAQDARERGGGMKGIELRGGVGAGGGEEVK